MQASLEARGGSFGPEIFGFCQSKAVEDHGIIGFLKLWVDLHRFEGLGGESFERSWLRVGARAIIFGLEIFRFCRSWADGSSGGTSFVKIFSNLCRFE